MKTNPKQIARAAVIGVSGATLAVSLTHLAGGIEIATGIPQWEAWSMAIAVDCGMVAAELAAIVDSPTRYTRYGVVSGLALSAVFNGLAFTAHATGELHQAIGLVLGCAVPASLYALVQTYHRLCAPVRAARRTVKATVTKLRRAA